MGFAFFNTSTDGWIFGPPEPPEKPIPAEFFQREPYLPIDFSVKGPISVLNDMRAARNGAFESWLGRVKDALASVGLQVEYNIARPIDPSGLYVLASLVQIRVGNFNTVWQHWAYDQWTAGQAAEQLRRDAKKIV